MQESLAYNRGLRRKINPYQKSWGSEALRKSVFPRSSGPLPEKTYDKRGHARVRRKLRADKDKDNLFVVALLGCALFAALAWTAYLHQGATDTSPSAKELKKQADEQAKAQQFLNFIEAAEVWWQQEQWYNAAFEYRKALELSPQASRVKKRLAEAAFRECAASGALCQEARLLLVELSAKEPGVDRWRVLLEQLP